MRLGFDLDGTIADLHGALALEARQLFPGLDPAVLPNSAALDTAPPADAPGADAPALSIGALSPRQQRELWNAVCARENFWETLEEIEKGSLKRLYQMVMDHRWELLFMTSRPESKGERAQIQSHRWLVKHGYLTPAVVVVHGSRGKICSALQLDVLVDDRPENCLDVAIDSSARAILMWRGDAGKVPGSARNLGIGSVSTMDECMNILEQLDRPGSDGGIVDRLKRLLGLGTSGRKRDAGHSRVSTDR
jgi:hypothetical protein